MVCCFFLTVYLNVYRVGDDALIAIAQGCSLHHLNVSGCHQIGDAGIVAVARSCPQLNYLDISVLPVSLLPCPSFDSYAVHKLEIFPQCGNNNPFTTLFPPLPTKKEFEKEREVYITEIARRKGRMNSKYPEGLEKSYYLLLYMFSLVLLRLAQTHSNETVSILEWNWDIKWFLE